VPTPDWDKPPAKGTSANGSSTASGNKKKGTVELATISDVLIGEEAEYGQENVFVIKYTDGTLGTSKARREILLCVQAMDAAQRDDWIKELIGSTLGSRSLGRHACRPTSLICLCSQ